MSVPFFPALNFSRQTINYTVDVAHIDTFKFWLYI